MPTRAAAHAIDIAIPVFVAGGADMFQRKILFQGKVMSRQVLWVDRHRVRV